MSSPELRAAAWSWADHLRAGGTTPWAQWVTTAPRDVPGIAGRGRIPGAAQLELVRRLAESLERPAGPDFAALADRALARSGPGRGPAHIPLSWPGDEPGHGAAAARIGVPPTDPASLPADELARAGVGLLADLVASAPAPPVDDDGTAGGRPGRRRPWHKAFHLAGPPVTTAAVRRSLALAGHHEGGRARDVVLLAEPLDVALAQVWSTRVQRGAPVRWVTFAGRWARRDQLPPSTDLVAIASWWSGRVGAEHVHVVTGPDVRRTAAAAASVLGVSHVDTAPTDPRSLPPAAVDVLRRLNRVLNVRLPEAERSPRLRWVASRLPQDPAPALAVPERFRPWLEQRAARVAEDLVAGGYAVHGDLTGIAPRHDGAPHPRNAEVLDLVLATVLDVAEQLRGREVVDR